MKLANITFEGANLISVLDEQTGQKYVAVNPIIDYFGLDRRGQHRKLERMAKEKGVDLKSFPLKTAGGIQNTLFININHLPAYLYSIQQSRVKPELREKLKRFQVETTKVINDYWNKNYSVPQEVPEYLMYGNVIITPKRAEILEKVAKFIEQVRKTNPVKAIKMMNKFLKNLGEKPEPLPIPPEDYIPKEDWLTVKEVATYFGVHPETVRKWIRNREILAIKYKGLYFISRDEFIFLAKYGKRPFFPKPKKPHK